MTVSREHRYPRAAVHGVEVRQAAAELAERIHTGSGLHFVFADPSFDREELARALDASFGRDVVGCTTAGEIGPEGYTSGSLVGFGLSREDVSFSVHVIEKIGTSLASKIHSTVASVRTFLNEAAATAPEKAAFGILLVDGLSMMEEQVVGQLQGGLRGLPLVGGSAGDGMRFGECTVFADGRALRNAAVLCVGLTERPFEVFESQHFAPTNHKLVITRADVDRRVVHAIDGRPAAQAHARILGILESELHSQVFSKHPLTLRIGGKDYVRSIQQANDDGSLSFFCAIDEGLVLTVAKSEGFLDTLRDGFEGLCTDSRPDLILGCECILRRIEVEESGWTQATSEIMAANRVVGFHTYGEQYGALHVNQTLTGLALW